METLVWIIIGLVLLKIILKAIRPDINRLVDKKIKKYYKLSLKWLERLLQK